MKKVIFIVLVAVGFQVAPAYSQFGIQAGPVGTLGEAFETADGLDKLGGTIGFTFGAFYNVALTKNIAIQPSVNYLNRRWGDELEDLDTGDITNTSMSINYLEIPVQLVYHSEEETGVFAGIGPSLMYGLSGKRTVDFNGNRTSTDYEFGSGANQESPMTIGFNLMFGYDFGKILMGLNYGSGLTNQATDNRDQGNGSHLALRVGYTF
ncbi:Outer membrane protein beta-barrel domain-containing protein [Aquiflexum balticum DSM 16537]|uniref:Outer membrane protein beta-barrel domain-containing protein n=1 Tax=Aquiflexum balticum DSM 16537 TaxID=758820 RepID=A0A1W2H776_9BACT|nr:porin family protein [Aquiflexum balticum]SMD44488.1 Outer membrane protein beta-barrel domain-containing protein [Aquiflexum balticum DSM 16537]